MIAEVNDALVRSGPPLGHDPARRPLLRNLAPGLTPEEETWLLALIALELHYDAIRHHSRLRP